MKIEFIFDWHDLWVGFFWDKKKKWMYFLPIPMCGVILKFNQPKIITNDPNAPWNWRKEHKRTPNEQELHEWMENNPR